MPGKVESVFWLSFSFLPSSDSKKNDSSSGFLDFFSFKMISALFWYLYAAVPRYHEGDIISRWRCICNKLTLVVQLAWLILKSTSRRHNSKQSLVLMVRVGTLEKRRIFPLVLSHVFDKAAVETGTSLRQWTTVSRGHVGGARKVRGRVSDLRFLTGVGIYSHRFLRVQ